MAFHSLLCIRDEGDIVRQSLAGMLVWADFVHVFDTGSTDDTWEQLKDIAASESRLILHAKKSVYFDDSTVRSELFNLARPWMRDGDWFLRADADEFHHVTPPDFVSTRVDKRESSIWHQYYDFAYTDADHRDWLEGCETLQDRARPISERRRYYRVLVHSEPRMFRYRKTMVWPPNRSCPFSAGLIAENRLPIRHYPNRDPEQMKRRCALRMATMAEESTVQAGCVAKHWQQDWESFIRLTSEEDLQHWQHETELPIVEKSEHWRRTPKWKRVLGKTLCSIVPYQFVASMLDQFRHPREFVSGLRPIPDAEARRIEAAMVRVR